MTNHYTALIEEDLIRVEAIIRDQFHCHDLPVMRDIGEHLIKNGGKRLRPTLLLLSSQASGELKENAYYLAAVIELMHSATLLHDDVIDLSLLRRNKLTTHEIWGNRRSILAGDFMFTRALELTAKHSDEIWAITSALAKTLNQITLGEMKQLQYHFNPDLDEQTYFQIIECKTASLFSAACEVGGLLNHTPYCAALKTFGLELGIAFQLIDDLLDYTSQSDTLGKGIGDDLAEGKATLPFIYAFKSSGNKKAFLEKALREGNKNALAELIQIMHESGAITYTQQCADAAIDKALTALQVLPDSEYKAALESIASFTLQRQY